jgi:hypothetical protein
LASWQRLLLGIVLLGSAGTLVELLLLEHTEDFYQLIPVILLGATVLASGLALWLPRRAVINGFRVVMLASLISAALGIFFHYQGNTEFALERNPKLHGWDLFSEAMMGATPSLAPGTMAQLALIGLLTTVRFRSA